MSYIFKNFLTKRRLSTSLLAAALLSGCQSNALLSSLHLPQDKVEPATVSDEALDASQTQSSAIDEPALEAAPLIVIEEPVIDLWQRTRSGFKMDLGKSHPRIAAELRWYKRHPGYMDRVADRANRYLYHIVNELEARDMPLELALLPVVESAFDPFAYSHGRASGIWQFIPSTGRHYGLKQNWWYDGRRDVYASTDAALTYLQRLHKRFDDWELALAAYNAGGGTVSKAIRKNRNAGKPIDFWSLNLPKETRAYVPKLIALSKLVLAPQEHGMSLKSLPNDPYFEAVDIAQQLDLAQAARMAEMDLDEIYQLNPGFNQWATDPEGPHRLLIPVAKAETFKQALSGLGTQQRIQWSRYKVGSGDSLILIAKRHNTTTALIKEANQLRGSMIRVGQTLLIPQPSEAISQYRLSAQQRTIARQGRSVKGKHKSHHTVSSGDSFWTIARKNKVSVRQLASWNNMAPGDPLRIGKKLVIWGKAAKTKGNEVIRKVHYKVRSGDNLSSIATRFRVGVKQIKGWNTLSGKYLQPGQNLTLYVNVTKGT